MANDVVLFQPGQLDDDEFLAGAEGRIRGYGKLVVSGIVEIGRELVAVKERVGHGNYTAFVTDRLGWSERSGRNFVSAYELLKSANIAALDDLTIDASSLYAIAAPSTPAEVREAVLDKAATPEGISRKEVEELIAQARAEADAAARSDYDGKLVLTPDELFDKVSERLEPLKTRIESLTGQRDIAVESLKKLQAERIPKPSEAAPIDGTMSFKAMRIRQQIEELAETLQITPREYIDIETEMATRAHQRSPVEDFAKLYDTASRVVAWLGEFMREVN